MLQSIAQCFQARRLGQMTAEPKSAHDRHFPPLNRRSRASACDRPERRNAMTRAMWRALPDLCARDRPDERRAGRPLEGAGGHFCAGADISGVRRRLSRRRRRRATTARPSRHGLQALVALDRPTIAALRGNAIGGGLGAGALLRFALLRGRRLSGDHAGEARPSLRSRRDAPAGPDGRPGARQGPAVQRPARRPRRRWRSA